MLKQLVMVAIAAAALTFAGCNKNGANTETGGAATDGAAETTTGTATEQTPAADAPAADAPAAAPAGEAPAAPGAAAATQPAAPAQGQQAAAPAGEVTLPGGTKYVDVVVGTGPEATTGQQVTVHYTGTLTDGTKFDSSLDHGRPFTFGLGEGKVIKGWDEGVAGMKVGGKRKLTVPADQAYGAQAMGPIPANSTLLFDVELLGVK